MSTGGNLPLVVREIMDLIGNDATSELVGKLGGTTFPVPKRQTAIGELRYKHLACVVGEVAAQAMVERFGGTDLYIPRCAKELQEMRDAAINTTYVQATSDGRSSAEVVNELARRYRVSDRRIWYILKTIPKPDNQLRLL